MINFDNSAFFGRCWPYPLTARRQIDPAVYSSPVDCEVLRRSLLYTHEAFGKIPVGVTARQDSNPRLVTNHQGPLVCHQAVQ